MDKSTHFFGQSFYGQLISLIDRRTLSEASSKCKSDRYIKRFTTKDHLISMLFCTFAKCTSLREVSGAMLGLSGKTKHFQLQHIPRRSTLSDANKRRDASVFACLYNKLLRKYGHYISDSRVKDVIKRAWSFSNLVSFCKIHLFNYLHLLRFFENPDKDWQRSEEFIVQYSLF